MRLYLLILTTTFLVSCSSNTSESPSVNSRIDLLPAPDKELHLAYETYAASTGPDSLYADLWCTTTTLSQTTDALEKLSQVEVATFLKTIHRSCQSNVEFSEWSNELLYEITARRPDLILELLSADTSLDREEIIWMYSNPIHDGFDLNEIGKKAMALEVTGDKDAKHWKKRMVDAILLPR